MFFEGSEKKFEVIFSGVDLRSLGLDFYRNLVSKSGAEILSQVSNEECDAFLLSESSLFVWKDRLLMITCGKTTLIHSLSFLIERVGIEKLESLIFQRKNEYYSHLQETRFVDDLKILKETIDGTYLLFGNEHEHHNCLFHYNKPYKPIEDDKTFELLMYDISETSSDFLIREGHSPEEIRSFFDFERILPGFEINDHVFEPYGYSMNAINGDRYCTMHVTPQKHCSYVSFETNIAIEGNFMADILKILVPESFDIMAFDQDIKNVIPVGYSDRMKFSEKLDCGYHVEFGHYFQRNNSAKRPRKI
ncbi:MAG: adenosylmethionine decarboxylase [Bacteriovoracaceae bacterium]|nr:adenosylmethionine decarboxylase [Bacteriovoracaceae bacterium]